MTQFPDDEFNENYGDGDLPPPHPFQAMQRPAAPHIPPPRPQQVQQPQPQHRTEFTQPAPQAFAPPPGMGAPPSFPAFGEQPFTSPAEALAALDQAQQAAIDPLARFYRVPGLTVMLPTRGAFFDQRDYNPALNHEVPIFPMRAQDELLMKNPDALMSGYAIEELLKSCVPAIRNPRAVSSPDLDVLLLAIRAASYGDNMEIEVACPSCGAEHTFECHLPSVMGSMTYVDQQNPVELAPGLTAYVKPYTLETVTTITLTSYEEGRSLQIAEASGDEVQISAARNRAFRRLSSLQSNAMIGAIVALVTPEATVTDRGAIGRFIQNVGRSMTSKLEAKLREINTKGIDKAIHVACTACQHEWETEIEFNPSTFFEQGS
jgi:hypothetical protein